MVRALTIIRFESAGNELVFVIPRDAIDSISGLDITDDACNCLGASFVDDVSAPRFDANPQICVAKMLKLAQIYYCVVQRFFLKIIVKIGKTRPLLVFRGKRTTLVRQSIAEKNNEIKVFIDQWFLHPPHCCTTLQAPWVLHTQHK